jgi:enamine deaminase RidA (YjgF/YER057c/UK114 family)
MQRKIGPDLPMKISPAALAGRLMFATNIPVDLASGQFTGGDSRQQALQTFRNVVAFVEEAGGSVKDIAQITIFITPETDFPSVAAAYDEVFVAAPYPTRATVVVNKLIGPPGMLIETTAHAVIG